jgi:hypothetical protein
MTTCTSESLDQNRIASLKFGPDVMRVARSSSAEAEIGREDVVPFDTAPDSCPAVVGKTEVNPVGMFVSTFSILLDGASAESPAVEP